MKCTCGTLNIFGAKNCKSCGASLSVAPTEAINSTPNKPRHFHTQQNFDSPIENTKIDYPPIDSSTEDELTFIPYTSNVKFNFFIKGLRKSFNFKTRASRPEFWYFILFETLILIVLRIFSGSLTDLATVLFLIPSVSVTIRRLHDIGRGGIWLILCLIPIVGLIIIYWLASDSQPEDNEWGSLVK